MIVFPVTSQRNGYHFVSTVFYLVVYVGSGGI